MDVILVRTMRFAVFEIQEQETTDVATTLVTTSIAKPRKKRPRKKKKATALDIPEAISNREPEIKACRFHQQGCCFKGDTCAFYHASTPDNGSSYKESKKKTNMRPLQFENAAARDYQRSAKSAAKGRFVREACMPSRNLHVSRTAASIQVASKAAEALQAAKLRRATVGCDYGDQIHEVDFLVSLRHSESEAQSSAVLAPQDDFPALSQINRPLLESKFSSNDTPPGPSKISQSSQRWATVASVSQSRRPPQSPTQHKTDPNTANLQRISRSSKIISAALTPKEAPRRVEGEMPTKRTSERKDVKTAPDAEVRTLERARKQRWQDRWWNLVVSREREARERAKMSCHDLHRYSYKHQLAAVETPNVIDALPAKYSDDEVPAASQTSWHSFLAPSSVARETMVSRLAPTYDGADGEDYFRGEGGNEHVVKIARVSSSSSSSSSSSKKKMTAALFDVITGGGALADLQCLLSSAGCDWDGRLLGESHDGIPQSPFQAFLASHGEALFGEDRVSPSPPQPLSPMPLFGGNAVHLSAACGRDDLLECLLKSAPLGIESKDKRLRETPLHLAARFGHIGCVKVLIYAGAPTDARDKHAETPLHAAARGGKVSSSVIRFLAGKSKGVNAKNKSKRTPLFLAASLGCAEAVQALLSAGAAPSIETVDVFGSTPITEAACRGYASVCHLLICRNGGLSDLEMGHSASNGQRPRRSPLCEASAAGHSPVVKILLLELVRQQGVAVLVGQQRSVIDSRDHTLGDTPLILALKGHHLNTAKVLLGGGATTNEAENSKGLTALMVAIMMAEDSDDTDLNGSYGDDHQIPSQLKFLLDHIELEAHELEGKYLSRHIKTLLDHRASSGLTALEWALKRGYVGGAVELIIRGAAVTPSALKAAGLGDHLAAPSSGGSVVEVPDGRSCQLSSDWSRVLEDTLEDNGVETEALLTLVAQPESSNGGGGGGDGTKVEGTVLKKRTPSVSSHFADVRFVFWHGANSGACAVLLAHSVVLSARSDYFRASLSRCNGPNFDIHMFSSSGDPPPSTIADVLSFLYAGSAEGVHGGDESDSLLRRPLQAVVDLLLAANRLLLPRLQKMCEHALGRRLDLGNYLLTALQLLDLVGGEESDLYWFVQDHVYRHRHLILLAEDGNKRVPDGTQIRLPSGFLLRPLRMVQQRQVELASCAFLGAIWSPCKTFDAIASQQDTQNRHTLGADENERENYGGVQIVSNEGRQLMWRTLGVSPPVPLATQPSRAVHQSTYIFADVSADGRELGDLVMVLEEDRLAFEIVLNSYNGLAASCEVDAERTQEWLVNIAEWNDKHNKLDDRGGVQAMMLGNERGRFACFLRGGLGGRRQIFYTSKFLTEEAAQLTHEKKMLELDGPRNGPLSSWELVAAAAEDPECTILGPPGQRSFALARLLASSFEVVVSPVAPNTMLVASSFEQFRAETTSAASGGIFTYGCDHPPVTPCDIMLRTDDGGSVLAHRSVLSARCERFRGQFRFMLSSSVLSASSSSPLQSETPLLSLEVPGVSETALAALIHFLYVGRLPQSLSVLPSPPLNAASFPPSRVEDALTRAKAPEVLLELCFVAEEFLLPQLQSDAAYFLISEGYLTPSLAPDALRLAHLLAPNARLENLRIAAARCVLTCCDGALRASQKTSLGGDGFEEFEKDDPLLRQLLELALSRRG